MTSGPTLDDLATNPQRTGELAPADRARLLTRCLAVLCALIAPAAAPAAKTDDDRDEMVSAAILAKRWQLPESWIREQARLGIVPSVKLGHYMRFRLNEVTIWLDRLRTQRDGSHSLPANNNHLSKTSASNLGEEEPLYMRRREVAAFLCLDQATIWRLTRDGKFPRPRQVGRATFWLRAEVIAWAEKRPFAPWAPPSAS